MTAKPGSGSQHCSGGSRRVLLEIARLIPSLFWDILLGMIRALAPYSWLPKKDVSGQVVLITGSARGIGRLMAVKFAKAGAKLALLDRHLEANDDTRRMILDLRQDTLVMTYTCDVSDRNQIKEVMEQVKTDLGDVDILINNAGAVSGKKIHECPDDSMVNTLNVNTLAHFWTIKSVLPSMLRRNHGHIVTIASAAGFIGTAGMVDYCASKFAAVGLTEALALELRNQGKYGVRTTTVCPYYINTGMFLGVKTRFPSLLPIMEPEYVADNIVNAILTNQEVLLLPRILYLAYFLKSFFPANVTFKICDFLGITHGMDEFVGRKNSRERRC